jgi:putative DNA base modification enzyme with NMAD domain
LEKESEAAISCGDNMYFLDSKGRWVQSRPAFYHPDQEVIRKDTKYHKVFVSNHFFYFGENAPPIPEMYRSLIQRRQGCSCEHEPETIQAFVEWLERSYAPGRHGLPRDRRESLPPELSVGRKGSKVDASCDETVSVTSAARIAQTKK